MTPKTHAERCGDANCYAHDGEACARGFMSREQCPAWKREAALTLTRAQVHGHLVAVRGRWDHVHYWQGKKTKDAKRYGTAHVSLNDDGRLGNQSDWFERRDIGVLQFSEKSSRPGYNGEFLFNVFIESDGSHGGPNGGEGNVQLSAEEQAYIDGLVAKWLRDNADFVARQRRWFAEKPWERLVGLTPDQAVRALDAAGW